MKKIYIIAIAALMSIATVSVFTSCGNNDDEGGFGGVGSLDLTVKDTGPTWAKISGVMSLNALSHLYLEGYEGDFPYRNVDLSTLGADEKKKLTRILVNSTTIECSADRDFTKSTHYSIPQVSDGVSFEVTFNGLAPSTNYYYRLRVNNGIKVNYSNTAIFKTKEFDVNNVSITTGTATSNNYAHSSTCSIYVNGNKATITNGVGTVGNDFKYGVIVATSKSTLEKVTSNTLNTADILDNYDDKTSTSGNNLIVSYNSKSFSAHPFERGKTYYYAAFVSFGAFDPIVKLGSIKSITTE